jgi:hypothetical protein
LHFVRGGQCSLRTGSVAGELDLDLRGGFIDMDGHHTQSGDTITDQENISADQGERHGWHSVNRIEVDKSVFIIRVGKEKPRRL